MKTAKLIFAHCLFWGWNGCTGLFSGMVLLVLFIFALSGNAALGPLILIGALAMISPTMIAIALTQRPLTADFLLRLFFGIQFPLVVGLLLHATVARDATWGSVFLSLSCFVAAASFGVWLLCRKWLTKTKARTIAGAAGAALALPLALGGALLLLLYAIPFGFEVFEGIARDMTKAGERPIKNLLGDFILIIPILIYVAFAAAAVAAFLTGPYFMAAVYIQHFRSAILSAAEQLSPRRVWAGAALIAVSWVALYASLAQQPQASRFEWLLEQDLTGPARAQIIEEKEDFKAALIDAYLYRYRYLRAREGEQNVAESFDEKTPFAKSVGEGAQQIQSFLLAPLIYNGRTDADSKAALYYQSIFDEPIQRAERGAVRLALRETGNFGQIGAGLIDIGAETVLLKEQAITVSDYGDVASIEIAEVYQNETDWQQEAFYYFSLPEEAAITGLWLGVGPDGSKHDAFVVAPRGAAQAVYKAEVQRRIDPALLEQVGPQQYRLRVFPILRDIWPETDIENEYLVHMRFTYAVPREDGAFALPTLMEARNVYWSGKTSRTLNGNRIENEGWLPASVPASRAPSGGSVAAEVAGTWLHRVTAPRDTTPLSVLVAIDMSYSMAVHAQDLKDTLAALPASAEVTADVFRVGDGCQPAARASKAPATGAFFGELNTREILACLDQVTRLSDYDGVIVLTDEGAYAKDDAALPEGFARPLWLVHVGETALAFDDAVLDHIYTQGGGSTRRLETALSGIRAHKAARHVTGGAEWRPGPAADVPANDAWSAIAMRQHILRMARGAPASLKTLDQIHDLAKNAGVVTPWSSMIVLINERQRQALKKAEEEDDRFDREGESGKEDLSQLNVSQIPEPSSTALFLTGLAGLYWARRRKGRIT